MTQDRSETATRQRSAFFLKLFISLTLITFLFSRIDAHEALSLIASADLGLLLLGGSLILLQTALSALKWSVLLVGQGISVPFGKLLKSYFLANFVNLFTPGFIGGDAYRSLTIRAYTGGLAGSVTSVLMDRLTGLIALAAIASVGLGIYLLPDNPALVSVAVLLSLGLGYGVLLLVGREVERQTAGNFGRAARLMRGILSALRPTKYLGVSFLISIVFQTNIVFITAIWSASLHLSATFAQLFLIVPSVYLLEAIPISINGIGLREGAFAVMFTAFHLPPEQGLALGLATSFMRYAVGAAGGAVWFVPDHVAGREAREG